MNAQLINMVKNGFKFLKNKPYLILCVAIFLFRLPPFLIVPSLSSFIQSANVARVLILLLFFYILFYRKEKINPKNNTEYGLVIVFFLAQSISIITTSNISVFLSTWKDIVMSIIIYYVTICVISEKNLHSVVLTLIYSTGINIVFQLLVYFSPSFIINLTQPLLYEKYWTYLQYQLGRNRFFGDSFDEVIIPLLMTRFIFNNRNLDRVARITLLGSIVFITFVSNWRTKAIILGAVLLCTCIFLLKKRLIFLFSLFFIAIVFFANYISISVIGGNVYDRFLIENQVEAQTVTSRITYWKEAIEMGMKSSVFGVGLGNYYDNLSEKSKLDNAKSPLDRSILIDDPHNIFFSIFATTGFVGLFSLILLLGYFIVIDIANFASINMVFIIMFWGLFIFALFNPFQYASYLYFFWFLRGIINRKK